MTIEQKAEAPARPARVVTPELSLLTACQFLYYGGLAVDLTLTAVVGLQLAPTLALATVPLTVMSIVATIASYFAGTLSVRFGHRSILIAGASIATIGGLISMWAVLIDSFALLCAGTAVVGLYKATGGYFRYLAADRAPTGARTRALSIVLCGGVAAAVVGPWAATGTSELMSVLYAGSYLLVAGLAAAVVFLMLFVRPGAKPAPGDDNAAAVSIRGVIRTTDFRTAFLLLASASGVMTLLMAMGPIGNAHAGHSAASGALMIQWHMVGMFAPSLFSGRLTTKWGGHRSALVGAGTLLAGTRVGVLNPDPRGFTLSRGLIGVGWNFLYVAGSNYVVRCYPAGKGGRVQGAIEASVGAVGATASLASAAIFQVLGWQGTNFAALAVCTALVGWLVIRARALGATPASAEV
ncbi:MAG: MFS transporter [Kibdelosporangium sp.]